MNDTVGKAPVSLGSGPTPIAARSQTPARFGLSARAVVKSAGSGASPPSCRPCRGELLSFGISTTEVRQASANTPLAD